MAALIFKYDTDDIKFYNQALTILRHMPPFSNLRTQEIFILGWLMYYYNKIGENVKEERELNTLLFTTYRSEIVNKLMLDDEDGKAYERAYIKLNNIFVSLRKKQFIISVKNKDYLNKKFLLNTKINKIEFNFNFK